MVASVKSILNCIGVDTSGGVSVLRHLFGFLQKRVPVDPCSLPGSISMVSLLDHVKSLKGKHIHLNIIRVGIDNFTPANLDAIDYAIYKTRRIYRSVNLGVGRVEHHDITSSNANGYDNLAMLADARDLINWITIPNNGLDVFIVLTITDSIGYIGWTPSPPAPPGPCDKDMDGGGLVVEVDLSAEQIARTIPHEIGHYLGLPHNHADCPVSDTIPPCCPNTTDGCNNLMAQSKCADSCGGGICQAVNLTVSDGNTVRSHCFVQAGC